MAGLLVKQRTLGESDLLIDFFTDRLGKLRAIVKGGKRSKKRFFGLLLTAHYLDLHLAPTRYSDLWRLEAAELIEPHLGLRQDHRRLMAAGPVLELLLKATATHHPQPEALSLALLTLGRLGAARDSGEMADTLVVFLTRLLSELGYGLSLNDCLHCGRPLAQFRHARISTRGGLVCQSCPPGGVCLHAPPGLVKGLAAAQKLDLAALGRLGFEAGLSLSALPFLSEFWQRVLGSDLPSIKLARSSLAG